MAIVDLQLDWRMGRDEILERIRREFPEIKTIQLCQDPRHQGMTLRLETRDPGIWHWNEEIVSAKVAGDPA